MTTDESVPPVSPVSPVPAVPPAPSVPAEQPVAAVAVRRTVLVTGGNRGIGFAIAEQFLKLGHRVAVTARSGQGPAGSLTVRADVTDAA